MCLAGMESEVEVVCLEEEEFGEKEFVEEEVSSVGEGSVEVSLVLVQCIFGARIQIR